MKIEQRMSPQRVELRAGENGRHILTGYAAVFHRDGDESTEYVLFDDPRERMTERVARGAFRRAIETRCDVIAAVDHDSSRLLGRIASGTLTLAEDEIGLRYDALLPDTQYARDLVTLAQRGDICASSFAFRAPSHGQKFAERRENGKSFITRTLTDLELFDVSPVVVPAYKGTSAAVRSEFEDSRREVLAALHAREAERVRVALRVHSLGN